LNEAPQNRPASLSAVLSVTFLGSVGSGAFWAGIFFVTASHYRFSPVRNLVLAAAMGGVYAVAARRAGSLLRALERRFSPRTVLAGALGMWGLASLAPLAEGDLEPVLWLTALVGGAMPAIVWPIIESFLAAGRHGKEMRSALGWFNVTWTPATAVPLILMPALAKANVLWAVAITAVMNAGAIVVALVALPRRPGVHAREAAEAAVGREYPWLVRSASWLLPLSYVMSATLAPVLPHRLDAVGAGAIPSSVVASMWMVTRFATLGLMWRVGFWHGRWGTLVVGAAALAAGLVMVLIGARLETVVTGLALFGVGMGLIYYSAIYYSMAVGHAAVDAGGTFEALIGLGYCVGPLLGLAGHASAGDPARAPAATMIFTGVVAALVAPAALRPYLAARSQREEN
jgi:hypothetical protein